MDDRRIERLVRRFYAEVWNRWDDAAVDDLRRQLGAAAPATG